MTSSNCTKPMSEPGPAYSVSVSTCSEGSLCPLYETTHEYPTFTERIYENSDWVCKQTTSCDIVSSLQSSIAPLQEYYQSSYDDPHTSRPFMSFLSVSDLLSSGCDKTIRTCMFMPQTGRRVLKAPTTGLNLETNLWEVAYVASADGEPTSSHVEGSITQLLQGIMDGDLFHTGTVFVAWYDLPGETPAEANLEVGALTDTLSYKV